MRFVLLAAALISLLLVGCTAENSASGVQDSSVSETSESVTGGFSLAPEQLEISAPADVDSQPDPPSYDDASQSYMPLSELPADYGTYKRRGEAADDGVVVIASGEIANRERLDEFLYQSHSGTDAMVRIITYTTEGDPIIYDLAFEGGLYAVTMDTTRDKFSASGHIETEYWPYLLTGYDNKLYFSKWNNIYGLEMESAPEWLDGNYILAWPLDYASDEAKAVYVVEETVPAQGDFYSPDGKAMIVLHPDTAEGASNFSVVCGSVVWTESPAMDGITVIVSVVWQDEKTAFIAGVTESEEFLFLPYEYESKTFGNWTRLEPAEPEEIKALVAELMNGSLSDYYGPGWSGSQLISESLVVTAPDGLARDVHYKTVQIITYIPMDIQKPRVKLYFDYYTGDYYGKREE